MHRSTPRTIAAGLCLAAVALTGCGDDDSGTKATTTTEATATTAATSTTSTTSTPAELQITDVWARQSPMATTNGAIYLTITSPVDDKLVSASVPTTVAAKTEIHETVVSGGPSTSMGGPQATTGGSMMTTTTMDGGMTATTMGGSESMTMRPVDAIALPAGEAVELKPGGYHVMLLGLVKPLAVGDEIPLTLTFEKAGSRTVTGGAAVGAAGAEPAAGPELIGRRLSRRPRGRPKAPVAGGAPRSGRDRGGS